MIHRDVKPENVLLADDGRVKVADFGLARAVSAETQHTAAGGVLIGTVSYLSPELVADAAEALRSAGALDVWVSNAGVSSMAPFVEVTGAQYDHNLNVNLRGPFVCGQAAARAMIALGRGGRIINTASMAGKQGRVPYLAHYVASKFGVVGLTQAMAFELAPHGILVNCVCPGFVATPMQDRELEWEAAIRGITPEEVKRLWVADTPLGRIEEPEDVARVVAFLAGPDAGFMTGEAVAVNGGAFMD